MLASTDRCTAQQQGEATRQQQHLPQRAAVTGWREAQAEDQCQQDRQCPEDLQRFSKYSAHGRILAVRR